MLSLIFAILAGMLAPSASAPGDTPGAPERARPPSENATPTASPTPIEHHIAVRDRPLHYNLKIEGPLTGGILALWAVLTGFESQLAPAQCHWCDVNSLDGDVRSSLVWSNTSTADTLSSVVGYILVPASIIGWTVGQASDKIVLIEDIGIIAEASATTMVLTHLFKYATGRQRPYAHFASPALLAPSDVNTSFFSGHTSFAFATAVSTATIASIRKSRAAPFVWATGLALASLTGYLRIAADRHYLTDVLTGATVGSLIGVVIPLLHRTKGIGPGVAVLPAVSDQFVGLSVGWVR